MSRIARLAPALLALLALPLPAQKRGTTVTLTVSPVSVDFAGYGGRQGAALARLSVSRSISAATGLELAAFALGPFEQVTIYPPCARVPICRGTTSPSLLSGVMASGYWFLADAPLRVSLGVGYVRESGGELLPRRGSNATLAGIEWLPSGRSRFMPTLGLRFVRLAESIAGARQLVLPGFGISF